MSTLHRCQFYSQLSLIQTPKGLTLSVHITQVSVLQSNLLNADTKETEPSVHITEVSVLQTNILNTNKKGTECPHYTGVCVTVKPP